MDHPKFVSIILSLICCVCISTKAEIIDVGSFDTQGTANDVCTDGDLAFIADGQAGLRIIDVSDIAEPRGIGALDTEGSTFAVAVRGNHAFLADGMGGLVIVDISDPAEPQALSVLAIGGSLINDVAVSGDYAYLTDMVNGMRIIDISDPRNPEQVSLFDTPDAPQGIFIAGDYAYIADRRSGLQIVDISNPEEPDAIGSCDTPDEANAVFVQDDYACVADKAGGLRIIDVSDRENPAEVGALDTDGLAHDVTLNGHYAYIADGAGGFLAVNVSDPENPTEIGRVDTPGTAYGVLFDDEYVFIADGEEGLRIIQLTPEIAVSDEELDFGEVDVGESEELSLTITNEGHNNLVISEVMVDGRYFSCDFEDAVTIGIGEEYDLTVTFSPEWFGGFEVNLTIVSNDPQNADINVDLMGYGNLDFNEEKITADDAEADDQFGRSVSIRGDYAIIGAHGDDDNGAISGSVYIFSHDGDDWTQQAKLNADDADQEDCFGSSVSISGDYAIVGAHANDDDGSASGSAYIFIRDGEDWTQQAKLTANDAAEEDRFGNSVSIDGNYAVVGAYGNDDDGDYSGSAYIFIRVDDDWTQQVKLTADDAARYDRFGNSVSISGDYAVVGAHLNDDDGRESGSAYIFFRDGEDWTQQAKLTANDADEDDHFGSSVDISGDYAVVGAYRNDDDGDFSGSAYIFVRDGDDWTQQAKLTADDAAMSDLFGSSVSISGSVAIIGAYRDDDDGEDSGSAYIFVRDGDDWTEQAKLTANDAAAVDFFGYSVSISSDFAIVGAYQDDDDGEYSGSAYIFSRDDEDWTQIAKLTADDAAAGEWFGRSVYISGDYAVVGASGSAYIYSIEFPDHAELTVEFETLSFNDVTIGTQSELDLQITNTGARDLQITDISIEGEGFNVEFEDQLTIEPDANEEITVTFSPEEDREYHAELLITSNDPINEVTVVELSGIGIPALRVELIEGWNLISINVSPGEEFYAEGEDRGPDIIRMMAQLRIDEDNHHVILMKDEAGNFYLPAFGYNGIPYWNLTEGYQVKVDEDVEATWAGELIPADSDIPLEEGWNLIAYFPTYELDASAPDYYVLSPIIDHVLIAKDADGAFMHPAWEFSNMPPWRETQGYQVKVDEDVVLNYPEELEDGGFAVNTPPLNPPLLRSGGGSADYPPLRSIGGGSADYPPLRSRGGIKGGVNTYHWTPPSSTGANMSVLILEIQNSKLKTQNSQIAAFNSDGLLVGVGWAGGVARKVAGGDAYATGLAVWGDDPSTAEVDGLAEGEAFELRYWDASEDREIELEVKAFHAGKGLVYETNSFLVVDVSRKAEIPQDYYLSQNYPNPFNSTTRISYGLPFASRVSLNVYDLSGRIVRTLEEGNRQPGVHRTILNAADLPSGLYFVKLEASDHMLTRKVMLIK